MKPNPPYIREIIKRVEEAPYPNLVGIKLVSLEFDSSIIEVHLTPDHLQVSGIVHGGLIASMIDTATFWSAYMRVPQADSVVNVDLKLNYLKSVSSGKLTAKGTCLRPGRTISYAEAKVYDEKRNLIAHGTSSLMTVTGRGFDVKSDKFIE